MNISMGCLMGTMFQALLKRGRVGEKLNKHGAFDSSCRQLTLTSPRSLLFIPHTVAVHEYLTGTLESTEPATFCNSGKEVFVQAGVDSSELKSLRSKLPLRSGGQSFT